MPLTIEIPGRPTIDLRFLLLDVNGTLSDRGTLIDGVADRLDALRDRLDVRLLSADTYGTVAAISRRLAVPAEITPSAPDKVALLRGLGADGCAAIGNGTNDAGMLAAAALGIAVIGPEGASAAALASCDLACRSILDALDLLHDPRALAATLRP